jgi:hypothetical protein
MEYNGEKKKKKSHGKTQGPPPKHTADQTSNYHLKKGISCSKQTDMTWPVASFTLQQREHI